MTMLGLVAALRLFSSCGKQGLPLLWGTQSSTVAARGLSSCDSQTLEHRFNGCGAQA